MLNNQQSLRQAFSNQFVVLLAFVGLLWALEIFDGILCVISFDCARGQQQPLDLGIQPRTWHGLRNILFAPFLHFGFGHLIANTIPLIVLGLFVMLRKLSDFYIVSVIVALVGGIGVWIFGRSYTNHLGASGLIFGYLGYLLLRGYFEIRRGYTKQSLGSIAVAVIVFFLYGSMLWGVLPGQPGISWLGHLFGFIGGGVAAYLTTDR